MVLQDSGAAMSAKKLNVVHICDHLGWPGSRMHGVKRLFAWMLPCFDPGRVNASLIGLRSPDTSGERLEDHGIDVTYMSRSKFDPFTLPALLAELDRRKTDIVHLHGYGATTFGRLAAARRGWPVVLHEHANLTDTPWFQKLPDRLLARYTDLAIGVSRSTVEFVTRGRGWCRRPGRGWSTTACRSTSSPPGGHRTRCDPSGRHWACPPRRRWSARSPG